MFTGVAYGSSSCRCLHHCSAIVTTQYRRSLGWRLVPRRVSLVMSYRRGVLIHSFNEERYGEDLQRRERVPDLPMLSVSHAAFQWKTTERPRATTHSVERHLLFGHGDMSDPHTSFQRREHAPAHQYFYQDPATIPGVGHLTADRFALPTTPVQVPQEASCLATQVKQRWGDGRRAHAPSADERFTTEYQRLTMEQSLPEREKTKLKHASFDTMNSGKSQLGASLRSASRLIASGPCRRLDTGSSVDR